MITIANNIQLCFDFLMRGITLAVILGILAGIASLFANSVKH